MFTFLASYQNQTIKQTFQNSWKLWKNKQTTNMVAISVDNVAFEISAIKLSTIDNSQTYTNKIQAAITSIYFNSTWIMHVCRIHFFFFKTVVEEWSTGVQNIPILAFCWVSGLREHRTLGTQRWPKTLLPGVDLHLEGWVNLEQEFLTSMLNSTWSSIPLWLRMNTGRWWRWVT